VVETAVGGLAMGAAGLSLGMVALVWLRTAWPVCLLWNPLERAADAVGLTPHVARVWDAAGRLLKAAVEAVPEWRLPRLRIGRRA